MAVASAYTVISFCVLPLGPVQLMMTVAFGFPDKTLICKLPFVGTSGTIVPARTTTTPPSGLTTATPVGVVPVQLVAFVELQVTVAVSPGFRVGLSVDMVTAGPGP